MKNYVFLTGDTHGTLDTRKLDQIAMNKKLTRDDVLIIAGDWGVLWSLEPDGAERRLLDWYRKFKCTILIVDGNHDNHERFDALPTAEKYGADVGVIDEHIFHLRRGRIYIINGKKYFIFGGALSIDKEYRTLGISYWPGELPTREQMDFAYNTLEEHGYFVDYVVTHTAPRRILNEMGFRLDKIDPAKYNDPTALFLDSLYAQMTWDRWYFGHMHKDVWVDDGKFRCLYQDVVEINDEEGD